MKKLDYETKVLIFQLLIFVLAIFLLVNSYIKVWSTASNSVEEHGFTVVEKKLSFHSLGRPYTQFKDDIVVMMKVENPNGDIHQAYYQYRVFFLKKLYISKYSIEYMHSDEFKNNETLKGYGHKSNYDVYNLKEAKDE